MQLAISRSVTWLLHARSFSTRSTKPGYGAWADAIELVDGHWSKDGSGLIVSDVAGQWHVYGMGPTDLMQRSRYDQFLTSEWHGLMRDTAGNVLDIETQQAPHIRSPRSSHCATAHACCSAATTCQIWKDIVSTVLLIPWLVFIWSVHRPLLIRMSA